MSASSGIPEPLAVDQRHAAARRYSMIFAIGEVGHRDVAYLRKPNDHKNPLFRGKWTVPGGLIEDGETSAQGAARELLEEAGIIVFSEELISILTFRCNCDSTEDEHEIDVFAVLVPLDRLRRAQGSAEEPVIVLREPPLNTIWYLEPIMQLVEARLNQPLLVGRPSPEAQSEGRPEAKG